MLVLLTNVFGYIWHDSEKSAGLAVQRVQDSLSQMQLQLLKTQKSTNNNRIYFTL